MCLSGPSRGPQEGVHEAGRGASVCEGVHVCAQADLLQGVGSHIRGPLSGGGQAGWALPLERDSRVWGPAGAQLQAEGIGPLVSSP